MSEGIGISLTGISLLLFAIFLALTFPPGAVPFFLGLIGVILGSLGGVAHAWESVRG